MTYYPPEREKSEFNCPYCGVYARQTWSKCEYLHAGYRYDTDIATSRCVHCNKLAYWHFERMLLPTVGTVELPAGDMPETCKSIYLEARDVVGISPRGAAALLRLCIQQLMIELGQSGKNINADIAALVKQGLPLLVQQSLDICRVVGNNAVHPGALDLEDSPEIAHSLFKLINLVVHDRITRPTEVKSLYDALPKGALDAISKRDSNNA